MSFDFFFTQHFILPVLIKMQETVKAVWSSLVSSAGIAGLQLTIKRSLLYGIFLYPYVPPYRNCLAICNSVTILLCLNLYHFILFCLMPFTSIIQTKYSPKILRFMQEAIVTIVTPDLPTVTARSSNCV